MDKELHDFLQQSSEHTVDAVNELRRALDDDRSDARQRLKLLEEAVFGDEGLIVTTARIDRRCGALVVEEPGPDGKPVTVARPARLGLDLKFVVGCLLTLITAGVVPVLVAHAAG